jgi:hypothetical protein
MPTEADARAEQHGDNCTEAVGSQLRSVHWPLRVNAARTPRTIG